MRVRKSCGENNTNSTNTYLKGKSLHKLTKGLEESSCRLVYRCFPCMLVCEDFENDDWLETRRIFFTEGEFDDPCHDWDAYAETCRVYSTKQPDDGGGTAGVRDCPAIIN